MNRLLHTLSSMRGPIDPGHHPHLLKGFEVYKGKAIFYSMGNFVFDQYSLVSRKDIETYGSHNVPEEKIKKKFAHRLSFHGRGIPTVPLSWPPVSRKTMIVKCSIEDNPSRGSPGACLY